MMRKKTIQISHLKKERKMEKRIQTLKVKEERRRKMRMRRRRKKMRRRRMRTRKKNWMMRILKLC
jgi:hypothetical protein